MDSALAAAPGRASPSPAFGGSPSSIEAPQEGAKQIPQARHHGGQAQHHWHAQSTC